MVVAGGTVEHSVLSRRVRVHETASVVDSVLFDHVQVGAGAKLRNCIIDKHVTIPAGEEIGYDLEKDRARFTVSENGIVVVPRRYKFKPSVKLEQKSAAKTPEQREVAAVAKALQHCSALCSPFIQPQPGWQPRSADRAGCWTVSDGLLRATPPCVDLLSVARYDDFKLELEFRYPEGSNSGVYLRGRYEIQIQDDRDKAVDPLRIGGVYGFVAPRVNAAGQPGEWQSMYIELLGRRVTVFLNGIEVIANREIPGITGGALDSEEAIGYEPD